MKLYYIIDAYCGWTYGFNHIFTKFMQDHPDIEIEVINGGLFVGDNKKKMVPAGSQPFSFCYLRQTSLR